MKNKNIKNGDIEVIVEKLNVLSLASNIPFQINQDEKCHEEIRLKYRFLDLRRNALHQNIILRSKLQLLLNFLQ
jgi:aspartyl-tRNA synthetase